MPPRAAAVVALLGLLAAPRAAEAQVAGTNTAGTAGGFRTLVLVDDVAVAATHSGFLGDLKGLGHEISLFDATTPEVVLSRYGEYLYDNVLVLGSLVDEFGGFTVQELLTFVGDGGNLFVGFSGSPSALLRELLEDVGVDVDGEGTAVMDHFRFHPALDTTRQHTAVVSSSSPVSSRVLGGFDAAATPVAFRGVGHAVDDENILAVRFLTGNPTSYSAAASSSPHSMPDGAGTEVSLVTGIQARNNARVVVAGSTDMLSNAFLAAEGVGNRAFAREVARWCFRGRAVLRFRDVVHHKSDGEAPDVMLHEKERPDLPTTLYPDPEITKNSLVYRIKDEIMFRFYLEEWNGETWEPFITDDVQLEFVMLDPYVRTNMTADADGLYTGIFTAPDKYGVFKFRVLYRRPGWSVVKIEKTVAVRPFKHNEYERFIPAAFPYYASSFSMMAGFFVLSVVLLFSDDRS